MRAAFLSLALGAAASLMSCSRSDGSATSAVQAAGWMTYATQGQITCPGPDVEVPFVSTDGNAFVRLMVNGGGPAQVTAIASIALPENHTPFDPDRPDKLYVDFHVVDADNCSQESIAGDVVPGSPQSPYYATRQSTLAPGQYAVMVLQPWFWDAPTPTLLTLSCNGDAAR
jgi:hypothetical protein